MLDVFDGDAFSMVSLTTSINKLPYVPSRLGQMGLFKRRGIKTLTAVVEERRGKLMLLPTTARGTMETPHSGVERKARAFHIPHIPQNDVVMADDVQGVRKFGSEDSVEGVTEVVNTKLTAMKQNMEVTKEWHRVGALKGKVLDADGTTTLFNWFTEFGITQTVVTMNFDSTDKNYVRQKCMDLVRLMETALGGTPFTGLQCLCGNDFFDALIGNEGVRDAYDRYQASLVLRQASSLRSNFVFGDISWENYRGSVGDITFIPPHEGYIFPTGTPGLFEEINAPADFIETVNTVGLPLYAKQARMEFDVGIKIHVQSNPLFICNRPSVLIKLVYPGGSGSAVASGS